MTSSENTCFGLAYPRTRDVPYVMGMKIMIKRKAQDELYYIGLQERVWPKLPPRQRRKKKVFTSLYKGSIVIMKIFDFHISTEISVLSLPEPILTIFGMTTVCVCVCADVRILHNSKS
ncbi:hypothetical protein O3M35_013283 [Rhynocoris fuscipes]|uniref:Uncharacterized protein n=1 Tax=Rhynocoris fuscipes TaxID=488301 RepID=A0AAW1CEH2_9HEMI